MTDSFSLQIARRIQKEEHEISLKMTEEKLLKES